jgi:hypothetical protein
MAMQNGSAYDVYIEINSERYEWFVRNSNAPGDYSTSNRTVRSFLVNHQEVYDGRVAIDMDPDFDDISTLAENPCGLNPNSNDTDGDGIEYNACANFDGDAKPDANDTDSDGDGIPDGIEDANKDGNRSATETFRLLVDSDGDGLADGTEDANRDGIKQANETSPIDRDTDDDGIGDGWAVFASSLSRVLTRDRLEHRHAGSGAPRAFTTAAAPG